MSQLPKGWVETNFEDVSDYIQRGKGPKYVEFSEYPVVNQKAVRWFGIQEEHLKYVHPEQWDKWDEVRHIREGDILWNSTGTGTIGRACHIDQTQLSKAKVVDSHVTIVRTNKLLESKFAFYWIMHPEIQGNINGLYNGSTNQVELSKKIVESTRFPLAPLAEQTLIVKKLDEVLAKVETTQARLARIPDIIKQFRQSVLAAAVSGRLTLNMDVEFQRLTINSVCNAAFDGPFGSKLKSSDYTNDGVRVIRLENIGHLEFLSDKKTYISKEKYSELKKNEVMKNDVLFSSFVDQEVRTCLFNATDDIYINKADCFCLRADQNKINPKYLSFLLASRTSYEQIKEKVQGVTRPRINLKILKSLEFMIPNIAAQNEIVSQVEKLFAYADTLEQQAEAAKARVDNLTQAILAKAFRGELTADWRAANPALISDDNSAAALLTRIQAERASNGGKKKHRSLKQ